MHVMSQHGQTHLNDHFRAKVYKMSTQRLPKPHQIIEISVTEHAPSKDSTGPTKPMK